MDYYSASASPFGPPSEKSSGVGRGQTPASFGTLCLTPRVARGRHQEGIALRLIPSRGARDHRRLDSPVSKLGRMAKFVGGVARRRSQQGILSGRSVKAVRNFYELRSFSCSHTLIKD
jgi:hypothetical protein